MFSDKRFICALCSAMCILLSASVDTFAGVKLDKTHFPDDRLREYLWKYDKDKNKFLDNTEIKKITRISGSRRDMRYYGNDFYRWCKGYSPIKVKNVTGLKYLTSLETLYLSDVKNSKVDLSANKNLKWISLENGKVKKLNLSKNEKVIGLFLDGNKLSNLDLSQQMSLVYLSCHRNLIKNLNLKQNKKL